VAFAWGGVGCLVAALVAAWSVPQLRRMA
jgi:hypothetical protein